MSKINFLLAAISAAFIANPKADSLIVFDDGNCFLPEDKHHADYHGRKENKKSKEVMREDYEQGIKQMEADRAQEKADAEAKAKANALKERALNAGLKQTATEEEVIAAEKEKADQAAADKEAADAAAAKEVADAAATADKEAADAATAIGEKTNSKKK